MDDFINQEFLVDEDSTPDRMLSFLQKPKNNFLMVLHIPLTRC